MNIMGFLHNGGILIGMRQTPADFSAQALDRPSLSRISVLAGAAGGARRWGHPTPAPALANPPHFKNGGVAGIKLLHSPGTSNDPVLAGHSEGGTHPGQDFPS